MLFIVVFWRGLVRSQSVTTSTRRVWQRLTMVNDRIKCIKKKRKVYNKDLGKQVDIDFLRLNITDN